MTEGKSLYFTALSSFPTYKKPLSYFKCTKETGILSDEIYERSSPAPFRISTTHFILAWKDLAMTRYDSCIVGYRKEERSTAHDFPLILFKWKQNDPYINPLNYFLPTETRNVFVQFAQGCMVCSRLRLWSKLEIAGSPHTCWVSLCKVATLHALWRSSGGDQQKWIGSRC